MTGVGVLPQKNSEASPFGSVVTGSTQLLILDFLFWIEIQNRKSQIENLKSEMSTRFSRDALLVLGLFVILIGVAAFSAYQAAQQQSLEQNFIPYSTRSAQMEGTLALYEWVGALGYKAQQIGGRDRGGAVVFERMVIERIMLEHRPVEHDGDPVGGVVGEGKGGHAARPDTEHLIEEGGGCS